MEFTIHVQVTGLDRLADSLTALAGAAKAAPAVGLAGQSAAPAPMQNPAAVPAVPVPPAPVMNPAATAKDAPVNVAPQRNTAPNPAITSAHVRPAPTAATPGYTLDSLSRAAVNWLKADPTLENTRLGQLRALSSEFGVQRLDDLPPEQFGTYALRLRQLGVAI